MLNKYDKIFEKTSCVSQEILQDYIDRNLSKEKAHYVEKHLIDCEMCRDEMEGMRLMSDVNRTIVLSRLSKKIDNFDQETKTRFTWLKVAGVAAIVVLGLSVLTLNHFFITTDYTVAVVENETITEEAQKAEDFSDSLEKEAFKDREQEQTPQEDKREAATRSIAYLDETTIKPVLDRSEDIFEAEIDNLADDEETTENLNQQAVAEYKAPLSKATASNDSKNIEEIPGAVGGNSSTEFPGEFNNASGMAVNSKEEGDLIDNNRSLNVSLDLAEVTDLEKNVKEKDKTDAVDVNSGGIIESEEEIAVETVSSTGRKGKSTDSKKSAKGGRSESKVAAAESATEPARIEDKTIVSDTDVPMEADRNASFYKLIVEDKKQVDEILAAGIEYYEKGEVDSAIVIFRNVMENSPEQKLKTKASFFLALSLYKAGKRDEGKAIMQKVASYVNEYSDKAFEFLRNEE